MNEPPRDQPGVEPRAVVDLAQLAREREPINKRRRWYHLFLPIGGEDVQAYRELLKYVRPYRLHIIGSMILAAAAGALMAGQIWILENGIQRILHISKGEKHYIPEADLWVEVSRTPERSLLEKTGLIPDETEQQEPEPGQSTTPPGHKGPDYLVRVTDPAVDGAQVAYTDAERRERRNSLLWISLAIVIAVALEGLMKYFQAVWMDTASRRVIQDLRMKVFGHVLNLSMRFHQRNHSADIVSRITNDLNNFGSFLTAMLVRSVREFFSFLAMIGMVIALQGSFIFVVGGLLALALMPVQVFSRKLRRQNQLVQSGMADIYTTLSEALVGQKVVKSFAGEEREIESFRKVNEGYLHRVMRVRKLRSITEAAVPTIASLGTAAILTIGGMRVLDGKLEPSTLIAIILCLTRAMLSMRNLSKQFNDFHIGMAAADRVSTLLAVEPEIQDRPGAHTLPPFSRDIRFENVTFCHEAASPTLMDIDLTIGKGETVALVGPSGAGKSTFIDLIPRFFEPDQGRITIDGHDIRDVTMASLRAQIAIVSQETFLFRGTVAENIAYGRPDADEKAIRAAAIQANAHDFIRAMPRKYGTRLGEKGSRLSGGERQRIAIARALLKDPPILILDEATSALDSQSEVVVQRALNRLMANRTVIVIAHRLSTIRNADRIVVMEAGRMVEVGNHDELMAMGGVYQRLYETQRLGMETGGGDPAHATP